MKVQFVYRDDNDVISERGKTYDVISQSHGWYRIDDGHGTALYPPSMFDVLDERPVPVEERTPHATTDEEIKRYVKEQYGIDDVEFDVETVGSSNV